MMLRRGPRWTRPWCSVALGFALVLASCSEPADTEVERSPNDGADAAVDAAGPVLLRLGLVGITTLDPAFTSPASAAQMALADLLYDPLTTIDDVGRVEPGLATYTATSDLRSWRFDIRPDARFADGTPVGADDVVHTLDRARSLGAGSLVALQLEDVTSVVALDGDTVQIDLRAPSAVLPEILAAPVFGITDRATSELSAPGQVPNTSGPYAVTEIAGGVVRLQRARGAGPETIEVSLYDADADAALAVQEGDVDWAPVTATAAAAVDAESVEIRAAPFHATIVLAVNPNLDPLDERTLRRAVALALGRNALSEAVFGIGAMPARGLVPAGTPGVDTDCLDPCGPDPEEATRLAVEAEPDPNRRILRLLTDGTPTQDAIAGVVAQQLGAAGIDVVPTPVDVGTFDQLIAGSDQPLYLFSMLGVGRSPASTLRSGFRSDSPDNLVGYRSELIDAAIGAALVEPVPAVRAARWRDVEAAILADAPAVPLVQLTTTTVQTRSLHGLVVRVDGTLDLDAITLSD